MVDLPVGTSITYAVTGLVDPSATSGDTFGGGETMSAIDPLGVTNTEANGGTNNTYTATNTDTTSVDPQQADIVVSMTGSDPLAVGSTDVYNIVVRNLGPSNTDTAGLNINDVLPDAYLNNLFYKSTVVDNGYSVLDGVDVAGNTTNLTPASTLTLNDNLTLPAGYYRNTPSPAPCTALPSGGIDQQYGDGLRGRRAGRQRQPELRRRHRQPDIDGPLQHHDRPIHQHGRRPRPVLPATSAFRHEYRDGQDRPAAGPDGQLQ